VTAGHDHSSSSAAALIGLVAVAATLAYLAAARRARRRGRQWPHWRSVLWLAGLVAAASALGASVTGPAHMDFRVHMLGHVLLGMLAPLLLVLAAPLTLALRALSVDRARRLSRVLHARVLVVAAHPAVAAVLDVGGLWVLYRTGLYAAAVGNTTLTLLVHAHVFVAGYLFSFALVGFDPAPHRVSLPTRAAVLVLAIAAHDVLAKTIYAVPPDGIAADQAAFGAQLMYYGGAPIEIALIVLLGAEWFRSQPPGPRPVLEFEREQG
jgi:putative membrane protein